MLTLTEVESFYGNIRALESVSLQVREGSVVTVLGPNGAGKTTTLRTVSGLMHPRRGSIEFMGRRIDSMAAHHIMRLGISMAPERDVIFPEMTTSENLLLGAITRDDRSEIRRDVEWVTELFPILRERWSQISSTLSGGEQRMLSIARALLARPKLLLLDEPSMGLAPVIVQAIFEVIQQISEQGTTILIVEQNARLALELSDYGYLLEAGRLVFEGSQELLIGSDMVRKGYLGQL